MWEHDYDPSAGDPVISGSQNSMTIQLRLSELLGGERNYLKMKMWMVQAEQNPCLTSDSYTHAYTYTSALTHIHAHTCTYTNKWTCTHIHTHGCAHMNKHDMCVCARACMNCIIEVIRYKLNQVKEKQNFRQNWNSQNGLFMWKS